MTTAEKLVRIAENEPKVYEAGRKEGMSFVSDNVGNALKGSASGETIVLKDVSPIEHNLGVKVESKNLIQYPYKETTKTVNGITFTDNGDGTVTANGTATGRATFYSASDVDYPNGDYIFSGCPSGGSSNTYSINCFFKDKDKKGFFLDALEHGTGQVVKATNGISHIGFELRVESGFKAENLVFKPMFEKNKTKTEYTPYLANPEAVKVLAYGGNLADIYGFSTEGIQNVNHDRFLSNAYGTTLSTTDAANSVEVIQTKSPNASNVTSYENGYFCIGIHNNFQDGDIVTVSFDVEITSNSLNATEGLVMSNGLNAERFELKNGRCSATLNWGNYNDRKYIEIRNAGCSAIFSNFQVELEGLSDYEPYKEPIEYAQGEEIKSIYPSTTLMTDTEGAVISVEYNRDINAAFAELLQRISSLGG